MSIKVLLVEPLVTALLEIVLGLQLRKQLDLVSWPIAALSSAEADAFVIEFKISMLVCIEKLLSAILVTNSRQIYIDTVTNFKMETKLW